MYSGPSFLYIKQGSSAVEVLENKAIHAAAK